MTSLDSARANVEMNVRPNRNIELKCRAADLGAVRRLAQDLGARDAGVLQQEDTFFAAPNARLKLRDFGDGTAEIISYRRPDVPDARSSEYVVCKVTDPVGMAVALAHSLGTVGKVRKTRQLFLHEHTRIHLDEVESLGTFVELETVLTDQTDEDGHAELRRIAAALGLREEDQVAVPYVELLKGAQ